jgi:hypothetical protein
MDKFGDDFILRTTQLNFCRPASSAVQCGTKLWTTESAHARQTLSLSLSLTDLTIDCAQCSSNPTFGAELSAVQIFPSVISYKMDRVNTQKDHEYVFCIF